MAAWDTAAQFDTEKDKAAFRDYEAACDRVKAFYKVTHPTTVFLGGDADSTRNFRSSILNRLSSLMFGRGASLKRVVESVRGWVFGKLVRI